MLKTLAVAFKVKKKRLPLYNKKIINIYLTRKHLPLLDIIVFALKNKKNILVLLSGQRK